ncbi:MAG: iron ABC transporter permease [Gammaproteobacteria bacterium]|nr:iron ABC transporter permease [Gammaproteobacteria bacterium]MBL7000403.1 iron ABC transporter permease [Gammaproteobacteria bacterium]
MLVALLLSVPVLTIASFVFEPSGENWEHLKQTVLPEYLSNSALLVAGVSVGTLLIGVSTAWLTAMCRFPGKQLFVWMLLLPLAMPAYIIAYTYTGLFDFAGPVQSQIREWTGWGYRDYYFPEVRSLGGAISMLSLVLYPYVYLLARSAFVEQSICVLEVSRTLGCGAWCSFYRVALPLARPAIVAGLSLALMETLADYGTVSYFGLGVFTTGIFRTWFGLGDSVAAAKMAAMLLMFVFTLVVIERVSRKQARYHHTTNKYSQLPEYQLKGAKALLAFLMCLLPVAFGFFLPAAQLTSWAIITFDEMVDANFVRLTVNTILLGISAALLSVLLAVFLAYGKRMLGRTSVFVSIRIAAIGYAIPGTVVAVGIIIPFAWLDNTLDQFMRERFDYSTGLLLSGTLFAVMFAYMVRFLAVSLQTIESGLGKIKPSMDDASRSLGYSPRETLFKVHMPLMKGSLLTALLIVFVDVMKELPATLILRPFNFNTLAVRAFELASDERLADSSTAALMIVVVGLLPVIYLSKSIAQSRAGHKNDG